MSNLIQLKDKFGNDLLYHHGGDVWGPPFPLIKDLRQHLADLRHLQLRPDDVILAGFPKSGFHWVQEVVSMLIQGKAQHIPGLGGRSGDFLDFSPRDQLQSADKPRVFFTHYRFHHLPLDIEKKAVKVIYLSRNPKDTWVSMYAHLRGLKTLTNFGGTWSHFFDLMMTAGHIYGNWFDYVLDWERAITTNSHLSLMTSAYEDMNRDPLGQIAKLNQFLGTERDEELQAEIVSACSFQSLKAAEEATVTEETRRQYWREGAPGFYRKGEIGDWKNWFTVTQNEMFDEVFQRRMTGSSLKFTFQ